jgi:threonine dehydratase
MNVRVKDIQQAHARIEPYIHRTPILQSQLLNRMIGCEALFQSRKFSKNWRL